MGSSWKAFLSRWHLSEDMKQKKNLDSLVPDEKFSKQGTVRTKPQGVLEQPRGAQ